MEKEKVIIIGASEHAKVIIDIFEKQNKYQIIGLLDANPKLFGEELIGYKILGDESLLSELLSNHSNCSLFIAIGDNWVRYKVCEKIKTQFPDVNFVSAIHPSAQIAKDVRIGKGVAIMAGVIINSSTVIGDFAIMNTKASADHDNIIGNFASLGPNATTGGKVNVGEFSVIGISATVKHGITIGAHAVIGGSSYLQKNCKDNMVMYGVPAKEIRTRVAGEKYL